MELALAVFAVTRCGQAVTTCLCTEHRTTALGYLGLVVNKTATWNDVYVSILCQQMLSSLCARHRAGALLRGAAKHSLHDVASTSSGMLLIREVPICPPALRQQPTIKIYSVQEVKKPALWTT